MPKRALLIKAFGSDTLSDAAAQSENNNSPGRRFTKEEDELLKKLAREKKSKTWKEIAKHLPGRSACQCRDRYNQYLFKEVSNKPWTTEEDEIIVEKYRQFGPHWVRIASFLPGRSGNNVKNRWNGALTQFHGMSHAITKFTRRSKYDNYIRDEKTTYKISKVNISEQSESDDGLIVIDEISNDHIIDFSNYEPNQTYNIDKKDEFSMYKCLEIPFSSMFSELTNVAVTKVQI